MAIEREDSEVAHTFHHQLFKKKKKKKTQQPSLPQPFNEATTQNVVAR